MSTATKLEYLNTTKEKIKDSINLTGANLTSEDTFRSYATKLKKGYIDIINNGINNLYNNFPKVSEIGSNLSLTPTYEAPMKLNEIQGNTLQDGTPTPDTPVEIQSVTGLQNVEVCGKNLFDKSTIIEGKYIDGNGVIQDDPNNFLGDFILIDNTKSYYVSSNTSSAKRIGYYNSNKEYISREVLGVRSSILTIPNNTKYVRLSCYNDNLDTLQLELGTQQTTYEPYKGNTYEVNLGDIELNKIGDYQDSIKKSSGKNLFDNNAVTRNKIINRDSGTTSTISNYAATDYIPIGENVTFTCTGFNVWYTACYDSNKTYLGYMENSNTMTTLPNTAYIRASILLTNLDLGIGQIELGTQQTSYEPYGKVWYITKNIGKVVLDGSENYTLASEGFYISNTNWDNITNNNCLSKSLLFSNYYKNYTTSASLTAENYGIGIIYNTKNLYIRNTDISTASDFKTWLSTHNTIVYYVLATPTYTEITNTELINQLETLYTAKSQEGTTNISITSEDLEMILNVSALKGEE